MSSTCFGSGTSLPTRRTLIFLADLRLFALVSARGRSANVFVPLKRLHVGSSCLSKAVKVFPVYPGPDVAGPAVADGRRAKRRVVCENGERDSA